MSGRLRVASYNIHECVGIDGRRDPARIAAVLREIDADVIGLQEVDARPGGSVDGMQMQYLAAALGHHGVAGPTLRRIGGEYGNALLTRWPVRDVRHVDLTVYRREPRAALDVDLEVNGIAVRMIVTHLGLLPGERRTQVRRLLDRLGDTRAEVVVLCGDINEWFAVGRPLRWLHARFGRTRGIPTFPGALPVFALDRIWVNPRAALAHLTAHRSRAARRASDHLPILADIRIGSAAT
ncbi:MAG TPA: endonuclease/exonuclease/phosphatase family protein [Polyangia bacterium]|jgi:endonuclease/exonuclease/phosphatase family metal-dependent hydrolase